jgi:hypothetical protein
VTGAKPTDGEEEGGIVGTMIRVRGRKILFQNTVVEHEEQRMTWKQ